MTLGSRLPRSRKDVKEGLPRTSSIGCSGAPSSVPPAIVQRSSKTRPISTVSNTGPNASSDELSNADQPLAFRGLDKCRTILFKQRWTEDP